MQTGVAMSSVQDTQAPNELLVLLGFGCLVVVVIHAMEPDVKILHQCGLNSFSPGQEVQFDIIIVPLGQISGSCDWESPVCHKCGVVY